MFGRPRCREWTPLSTQQLRLRSLIQIVGYNIRPPEWCSTQCSFYLTLHHTTMSAPFYTSERICSPHPKWKEIDSEITHKFSSSNVVIRIWCQLVGKDGDVATDKPDSIIQTWGIYFSGLRYLGANLALNFTSDCFKSNTLVFQMHGGYFCSYKSLKLDVVSPENEAENGSLSSDSSGKTMPKTTIGSKFIQQQKKGSRSISPSRFAKKFDREYSRSHSPTDRTLERVGLTIHGKQNSVDGKSEISYIYEHSPDTLEVADFNSPKSLSHEDLNHIDVSETAEDYDLRIERDIVPKYRYLALSFLKSEIRPSYNATKLQKLHLLQYSIKKKQEAVQEIKERIYKKYTHTNQLDEEVRAKFKSRSKRNLFSPDDESGDKCDKSTNGKVEQERQVYGPRLTLKLNDLLSFKAIPSPFQRSEHVRLTKQLEVLRFKRIILADERDSKMVNIRRLKEMHSKLNEENQDLGVELMQAYHCLSRRAEALKEMRQSLTTLRGLAAHSHSDLAHKQAAILKGLHDIFYIEQKDELTWCICDVPLPVCGDDWPTRQGCLAASIAAGLAAQAIVVAAASTHCPLRYRLTIRGSASTVTDTTPHLPDPNIPLFARGGDITLFRYGMFLLNKTLCQLMLARQLPVRDVRPTLANLQKLLLQPIEPDTTKIFGTPPLGARAASLRSVVADRDKLPRQFNRFKDSVDGQSPTAAFCKRHRLSRSVGSYRDEQELTAFDTSTTSIMGSESDIYNAKLTDENKQQTLQKHNSESQISRLSTELKSDDKVVFTLGGDEEDATEKLVKISSNNADEQVNESVKKICNEIEHFCIESDSCERIDANTDIDGVIDIARYMASKSTGQVDCEHCDAEIVCDDVCAKVSDVIVIPSAEAVLNTEHDGICDNAQ